MAELKQSQNATTAHAKRLISFLAEKRESISPLLILMHDYPDPDALASAIALQYLGEKAFGIQSRIVYGGTIGRTENKAMAHILKLPVHKLRSGDLKKYNYTALIDTQPNFKNNPFSSNRRATMVIDQHPSVTKPVADFAIVDTECGATSVILARALFLQGLEIPPKMATALAYGILTDTLNLFRAQRPHIIDTYTQLLPLCDMRALAKIQNPQRSRRFFASVGKGIHQAMVRRGLVVSHLGQVENPDLVAQVADFLLMYKGVKKAFCTGRYKNKLYTSLRLTTANAEAGEVLRDIFDHRGDAGGHGQIGGGSFNVPKAAQEEAWMQAEQLLTERLVKRLRISSKSDFYYPFRKQ